MPFILETVNIATVEALLFRIPESVDLLIFGIGLTLAAVLLRGLLGRDTTSRTEGKFTKKA